MRILFRVGFLVSVSALAAACSGGDLAGVGTKHGSDASSQNDTSSSGGSDANDDETLKAGQPQQVSGAFLTGCAPVSNQGPQDSAHDTYGCALVSRATGKKYPSVGSANVAVFMKDDTAVRPSVVMAPASSVYNLYFQTARGAMGSMASMSLHMTMDNNTFGWNHVAMYGENSDPSSWLALGTTGTATSIGSVMSMTNQVMFLSSVEVAPGGTGTGQFTGSAGADAVCAGLASTAGLPGTWVAVLSDGETDAKSKITIETAVTDINGNVLAPSPASFGARTRASRPTRAARR